MVFKRETCTVKYETSALGTSRMRLNMGDAEGVEKSKRKWLENWQCGKMPWEFCFCVTCSGNSCGHYLMDVTLPPVGRLTVLHSFFDFQGFSVALCVCFPEVIQLPISLNWFSREWNPFQLLHVDSPAAPKYIYLWVAKWHWWSFLPFVHVRFLYIVFAARPVELIHWI